VTAAVAVRAMVPSAPSALVEAAAAALGAAASAVAGLGAVPADGCWTLAWLLLTSPSAWRFRPGGGMPLSTELVRRLPAGPAAPTPSSVRAALAASVFSLSSASVAAACAAARVVALRVASAMVDVLGLRVEGKKCLMQSSEHWRSFTRTALAGDGLPG